MRVMAEVDASDLIDELSDDEIVSECCNRKIPERLIEKIRQRFNMPDYFDKEKTLVNEMKIECITENMDKKSLEDIERFFNS